MGKIFDDLALVEEYRKFRSCRIVAEKYGCSDETVRRALIKYEEPRIIRHPRKGTKQKASNAELLMIVNEYYSSGLGINELASKYHRSQKTVSNAIKTIGHGLKETPVNARKITDEELQKEALTLNCREIAIKYNMSEERIWRRARGLGIKLDSCGSGGHWKRRADRYGCIEFDNSITLKALNDRDKGICQICGGLVDFNDIVNGHIGRFYPTLDHIVPLSKGGAHTWSNVQLAHMCCNAGKCDRTV